mgnify:CR=1 FL=1
MSEPITLTGHQLKAALVFLNPDGADYPEQLDGEVCIARLEDGHSGTGYYAWATGYGDEGCVFLSPDAPVEAS